GKVCVVTGAARSIGLGNAEKYCANGAAVAMIDINPEVVEQAERLAREYGVKVKGYILNITNRDEVLSCFEGITAELGPIFALVNNAGIVDQRPFEEITEEQINKQMAVNVNGTLFCAQGAVKSMKEQKEGRIINFSSKSGKTGSALMAHYSAAKGAIIALTHALAFELAPFNIQVNSICPGITDATGVWGVVSSGYTNNLKLPREEVIEKFTAKIPLKRLTNIEDVVEMVYFLTLKGDYMTGQAYNVTGGREMH
ncbi:MAG TPA: SDR family NAD(P)-dependent oxidoreductase, partial [Negativicutes bacterium]|nr:SDR family NAD(P)-dependent oxidoreductase [Negativicutes bacterium]